MNNNLNPRLVIPMVTEVTERGERAYDIFSLLLRNRIIIVGDEINDQTAPIQMYVNSPGGVIYSGLAIYDTMQMIPNPITTLAVGVTASFGTVLLTGGTKGQRYALPHATIHMHQPLGGAQGQATEIEIQAREILRLKSRLNEIMSMHTGQPLEVIERDTERDFFLTAEQAVSYGLIDHVMEVPAVKKLPDPVQSSS
jgi:ATP-dependent Clp protease protease subunit